MYSVFPDGLSEVDVVALMNILIGHSDTEAVKKQYPLPPRDNTTDYRDYGSMIVTDGLFRCPSWNVTMQHAVFQDDGSKKEDAWFYHFDHVSSFSDNLWGENYTFCDTKVCHGSELPYVFHPNGAPDNATYTQAENEMALIMQTFWGNMAKNGDP